MSAVHFALAYIIAYAMLHAVQYKACSNVTSQNGVHIMINNFVIVKLLYIKRCYLWFDLIWLKNFKSYPLSDKFCNIISMSPLSIHEKLVIRVDHPKYSRTPLNRLENFAVCIFEIFLLAPINLHNTYHLSLHHFTW